MLEPKVECVYHPSFKKSVLRTMGASFMCGYAVGASFRWISGSRCNYGQYLGNKLCVAGMCFQLGRRGIGAMAEGMKNNFIPWRFSPWK
ncbi:hypothetical protein KMI_03g04990 [Encephalitozoon hellem]|uniref:Uncharacterized protein n=1 Tax=Encephalitozoon hellem TaxID=27973 RepID=A0A9Q9C4B1_ENCHE|nr:uncharacterized protein EHEL_060535 [Encephalitozoon hellem ATCC 50504]AHL28940.1 hypothetical protein EHEL_060535 [Encephalitozoon hellem ATCC 50504]KAG5860050.1 hypothetical protein KMI_03g04990 [Encephalitozoon hellem]UTX43350.1 hypothetical protein GPU96_06g10970 [Encephalitozoon hellem]WEL38812.1 hypothetical protein PFJ87_06g00780 [Encephalitozoon hellem]